MSRVDLPREIVAVIDVVLETAALDVIDGRDEVARELRAHFEDGLAAGTEAKELIEKFGDPRAAGRRIARTRPRAAARSRGDQRGWWMSVNEWKVELLHAVRRLRRAPGFTTIVVMTLALGVGVNTAIFTVLNAVLLQELPYAAPDRLVRMYEMDENWNEPSEFMRAPALAEFRRWEDVFENVAALYTYREVGADLTDGDAPQRVTVLRVSAGYFETLGRAPLLGRTFTDDESYGPGESTSTDTPAVQVAILGHELWQARYEGTEEVVGSVVELGGASFEVVGVMPASFRDPFGSQIDLWLPQDLRSGGSNSFGNYYLSGVARLADGVTVEAARERLAVLSAGFVEIEPQMEGSTLEIRPLQADIVGSTRMTMLWILAAAASLVLLTACVNVGNLLFARGLSQDRGIALRSALGSGRGRLMTGIFMENGLLAGLGGGFGLALGWVGLRALLALAPDALPIAAEVRFGTPVFLFALAVTAGALLLFGLTPALRMSRTAPAEVLRSGDRSSTVGKFVRRIRDGLVIIQIAAALVLVAGAALLTRSFASLLDVPLAIEAEGVLTFEVHLPTARYPDRESRARFHEELQATVRALPGVQAAGATSWLPVNGRYHSWGFGWVQSDAPDGPEDFNATDVRIIQGDYFAALDIDLLRGEGPSALGPDTEPVAWINSHLAETVFAGVDPLSQRINLSGEDRRIVGVVEDVPFSARGDMSPKTYLLHSQADSRNWALIQTVKASGDLNELREVIRGELRRQDPNLVLYRPRSLDSVLGVIRAQDRFATTLMGAFAVLALLLSLVGTYGVLAGSVAGRTREIGIRMALGADAESVRGMVWRYALHLTVPGLLLGLGGATRVDTVQALTAD